MNYSSIKTFGELKKSGYKSKTIKDELRENLLLSLKSKQNVFEGILPAVGVHKCSKHEHS